MGAADFIEQGENLKLRFQFFGHGFDDQVRFAGSILDRSRILQTTEGSAGLPGGNLSPIHRPVEMSANFLLRPAQGIGKQIFENGAIAAKRRQLRDAPAPDTGADDRHSPDLHDYWAPFSRVSSNFEK